MGHCGDQVALFRADRVDLHHEWHIAIELEPLGDRLAENGRRERPKRLPALDLEVEDLLHVRAARVAQNRAVAERPRAPLHASLEPPDYLPVRDRRRGAAAQLI